MNGKVLVFVHIPKTAGTTINAILEKNFSESERYHVNPCDIAASRAEIAGQSIESRQHIHLLYGHMGFGWHDYMPRPAVYATFLRDPVKRVVSHYNYVRFRADHEHYLRQTVEDEKMGIREYVESGVCDEVNNGQVRLLTGIEDIVQQPYGQSKFRYGFDDDKYFELAIQNLDRYFGFVGVQEYFDESLILMRDKYRLLRAINYSAMNVGTSHYSPVAPTETDLEVIRRYNGLDIRLYEHVRKEFLSRWGSLRFRNLRLKNFRSKNSRRNRV